MESDTGSIQTVHHPIILPHPARRHRRPIPRSQYTPAFLLPSLQQPPQSLCSLQSAPLCVPPLLSAPLLYLYRNDRNPSGF